MQGVKIAIRADAGVAVGNGHVMRCLVLAAELRDLGCQVVFVMNDLPGNLAAYVINKGFVCALLPVSGKSRPVSGKSSPVSDKSSPVSDKSSPGSGVKQAPSVGERTVSVVEQAQELDQRLTLAAIQASFDGPADWLIVDHYQLDAHWHRPFYRAGYKILVLDDLANRSLYAHLILDQTYGRLAADYQTLVPETSQLLLGTNYGLLRREFRLEQADVLARRGARIRQKIERKSGWRILVSLGGTDPQNITAQVLNALLPLPGLEWMTVVMGAHAPGLESIRQVARHDIRMKVLVDVENMAELLLQHDLAIGAGGTSAWERCATGLPCITLVLADNQRQVVANLLRLGVIQHLEFPVDPAQLQRYLTHWDSPEIYLRSVQLCLAVCDGFGAERVAGIMLADKVNHNMNSINVSSINVDSI